MKPHTVLAFAFGILLATTFLLFTSATGGQEEQPSQTPPAYDYAILFYDVYEQYGCIATTSSVGEEIMGAFGERYGGYGGVMDYLAYMGNEGWQLVSEVQSEDRLSVGIGVNFFWAGIEEVYDRGIGVQWVSYTFMRPDQFSPFDFFGEPLNTCRERYNLDPLGY